jgi:Ca2+-transporting ATPase
MSADPSAAATPEDPARNAHALPAEAVLAALGVDPSKGLDGGRAAGLLARWGPNAVAARAGRSALAILAAQFRGTLVLMLLAAAALSFWMGERLDAAAILAVLAINALIGFVTEMRARASLTALRKLTRTTARVRRDGAEARIAAEALVPGDIVVLDAGDVVPADLRLIEAADLTCDESTLTGESAPVLKTAEPQPQAAQPADRLSVAWRGAAVTRGSGVGVVIATGPRTQLGEIAALVSDARDETTPLERRLNRLGARLAVVSILAAAAIAVAGLADGRPLLTMIQTAIALAVATAPEGLPIVATVALARGMWRMAARNALINRLSAVETLGVVSVLITDKTGTLTQNRMTAEALVFADGETPVAAAAPDDPRVEAAVLTAVLCNDADGELGDPMERALLEAAAALGRDPAAIRAAHPRVATRPFDAETKLMVTVHGAGADAFAAVKGAPEAVIAAARTVMTAQGPEPITEASAAALRARIDAAAARGLRLLGLARADGPGAAEDPYADLALIGFVALADPPREDVAEALADCRSAGVRVVMATGDHIATGRRIAQDVGLIPDGAARTATADDVAAAVAGDAAARARTLEAAIFPRVHPRAKYDLVDLHQQAGAVVAMIGDGVNDAPALRKADIGVAMGQRGAQVAAEAADVVLRDDSFASIVHAIREGRIINHNIRVFIVYLFACNVSEVLTLGAATVAGAPLPLTPLQILFLNLVTDVFPALALGLGEGSRAVMRQAPRPRSAPLVGPADWAFIGVSGVLMAAATLAAYAHALSTGQAATTVAFLTIGFAQLLFVFAMRMRGEPLWSSEVTRNRWVWAALPFSGALLLVGLAAPRVGALFDLSQPAPAAWLAIAAGALAPLALVELGRALRRRG